MTGSDPLSHVVQHPMIQKDVKVGPLTPEGKITLFSDHISMLLLAGVLLMLVLPRTFRRKKGSDEIGKLVPSGFRNGIEAICHYLREEVAKPNLLEHTDRFIKYIWSVFFFVLTVNVLGLMPFAAISPWLGEKLGFHGVHLGGTATANIWVTATLAVTTVLMMLWNGVRYSGVEYLKHFAPGPLLLKPLMLVVEIVGVFAKGFALAVRLFANMVAGHTLMAVLLGFVLTAGAASWSAGFAIAIPVVLSSTAITLLEIFVAFLQAYIFTFLTTLFIGQAIHVHHHDDHEEAHAS